MNVSILLRIRSLPVNAHEARRAHAIGTEASADLTNMNAEYGDGAERRNADENPESGAWPFAG